MLGPDGLNPADPGIALLGDVARELEYGATAGGGDVLLVHCGDVPAVGDGATRLILDVRERLGSRHRLVAANVAGPAGALRRRDFAVALLWPRAHLGMDFSEACIAAAARHVRPGGHVLLSARKQKGGKRLAGRLQALCANLRTVGRRSGYAVHVAERGESIDEALADELLGREYWIGDELLGELELRSRPGVFSRKGLDDGTRCLLEHVLRSDAQGRLGTGPERVIDLCAGVGPLGLRAALDWPQARVLAVESNHVAASLIEENAARAGAQVAARVTVRCHDGMPTDVADDGTLAGFREAELALVNPPTHADRDTLEALLGGLRPWLGRGKRAMIVVNRPGRTIEVLKARGATGDMFEYPGYVVIEAYWP